MGDVKVYKRSKEEEAQIGREEAARFDIGKIRHDLIPPYPLDELAKVYTYGTNKYDEDNYLKGMKWRKVIGPLLRHLWKWIRGKQIDEESNCHHLAMVVWQCFTLMMYEKYSIGQDNRCPYLLDLMEDKEEQKRRIEMWKDLAKNGKLKNYNGLEGKDDDKKSS
ncbi:MAG: DUF5664 domain-containing protein [Candidatus Thorarchaeota archaeon]|jgi:hypothetical protein